MQNLLKLSYWFESLPTPFLPWVLRAALATFIVLALVGLGLTALARRRRAELMWRKGYARLASVLFQTGAVGLILVWLTEEQVPFFGIRFWFLVLLVVLMLRLALVVKKITKDIPAELAARGEEERIRKYLP